MLGFLLLRILSLLLLQCIISQVSIFTGRYRPPTNCSFEMYTLTSWRIYFFRVFVWVLLMFHPTSTLNRKDCRIVFLSVFVELNVLDTGLRFYGRFPDFFTHRFFIVERSEVTVATKRSRKIRPVKRAAIFCTFSLRLPH